MGTDSQSKDVRENKMKLDPSSLLRQDELLLSSAGGLSTCSLARPSTCHRQRCVSHTTLCFLMTLIPALLLPRGGLHTMCVSVCLHTASNCKTHQRQPLIRYTCNIFKQLGQPAHLPNVSDRTSTRLLFPRA